MTLRQQAIHLINQLPEEQLPDVIQYIYSLVGKADFDCSLEKGSTISQKLKAFMELEKMAKPISKLDYAKELEAAREAKYGHPD